MPTPPKRPRDPISLAKMIGDIATGNPPASVDDAKDPAAVSLGRKGGQARAASLTKKQRSEIARKAAAKRWKA